MVFLTLALLHSSQSTLIENFSNDNDDDDVNENGKKKNNRFRLCSHYAARLLRQYENHTG